MIMVTRHINEHQRGSSIATGLRKFLNVSCFTMKDSST